MDPLDALFRNLDTWRHLPNYQLERRADIFFSIYLKGVAEEFTGADLDEVVIPELPLKRDLIWPELSHEQEREGRLAGTRRTLSAVARLGQADAPAPLSRPDRNRMDGGVRRLSSSRPFVEATQ